MKQEEVRIWEEAVTLPTYEVGKPDKNPMFLEKRVYQGSSGRVYPYPVVDKIEDEKVDKVYHAVYLENRYLKVMVLPELGGRIHRAIDKTNNYDFVYYNHVVKPALVGLAGPWISGGIEFNWPQHHRPSSVRRDSVESGRRPRDAAHRRRGRERTPARPLRRQEAGARARAGSGDGHPGRPRRAEDVRGALSRWPPSRAVSSCDVRAGCVLPRRAEARPGGHAPQHGVWRAPVSSRTVQRRGKISPSGREDGDAPQPEPVRQRTALLPRPRARWAGQAG